MQKIDPRKRMSDLEFEFKLKVEDKYLDIETCDDYTFLMKAYLKMREIALFQRKLIEFCDVDRLWEVKIREGVENGKDK